MVPQREPGATFSRAQHADIRWNPELEEWFCASCGRTSDHTELEDAWAELDNFICQCPRFELGAATTETKR